jgi:hypothetical protein
VSLNRRGMNFTVLLFGMILIVCALAFYMVPSVQPQAILQVSEASTSTSSAVTSISPITTASSASTVNSVNTVTSTGVNTYTSTSTGSGYTVTNTRTSTSSSIVTVTSTNPPVSVTQPAYWLTLIIALFALTGILLVLRGFSVL